MRSVLAGKPRIFVDSFDDSFSISHDLSKVIDRRIRLKLTTDSESPFKVLVQVSSKTEKGLMIDLQAFRKAYQEWSIDKVGWERSEFNGVDGFTKMNKHELIGKVMRTG